MAKRPTTPSGKVEFTLRIALPRDLAERLTAKALRAGKNVPALVTEILEAEVRRR